MKEGKDLVPYSFIYMKCPEKQICRDREKISGCLGLGMSIESTTHRYEKFKCAMKRFRIVLTAAE